MRYTYIVLAILLLLCVAPMPYGYYQLVRFVAMIVFGVMAYRHYTVDNTTLTIIFGALALLFQPFFKIALGRLMWNVVDVMAAIALIMVYIKENSQR